MNGVSFDELQRIIRLTFRRRDLLRMAFTHGSIRGRSESKSLETYRRLEFLGDAVIRLAVSEAVYKHSGGNVETLHNRREKLVPNSSLTKAAERLGLMKYLRWSGSEDVLKSRRVPAKVYESLTGAIFLDRGYDEAVKFVDDTLISRLLESERV